MADTVSAIGSKGLGLAHWPTPLGLRATGNHPQGAFEEETAQKK
jgi:hypothetical protein